MDLYFRDIFLFICLFSVGIVILVSILLLIRDLTISFMKNAKQMREKARADAEEKGLEEETADASTKLSLPRAKQVREVAVD